MSVKQKLNRSPLLAAEDFWRCLWTPLEQKLKEVRELNTERSPADSGTLFQPLPQRIESHPLGVAFCRDGRAEGGVRRRKTARATAKRKGFGLTSDHFKPGNSRSKWDETCRELLSHRLTQSPGAVRFPELSSGSAQFVSSKEVGEKIKENLHFKQNSSVKWSKHF